MQKTGQRSRSQIHNQEDLPSREVEGEIMAIEESVDQKKSSKRSHKECHTHRTHQNKRHKARPNSWNWPSNFPTIHRHKYHHVLQPHHSPASTFVFILQIQLFRRFLWELGSCRLQQMTRKFGYIMAQKQRFSSINICYYFPCLKKGISAFQSSTPLCFINFRLLIQSLLSYEDFIITVCPTTQAILNSSKFSSMQHALMIRQQRQNTMQSQRNGDYA